MTEEFTRKPIVLIVDDVGKNLQVLGSILYDAGYEIAMADNGLSALEILESIRPDIILLDIMMPEMDGFEVCDKIKELDDFKAVPIIFLTAKSETDSIIKGFEHGAADYVTKPFNSQELLARVKTHVELKLSKELLENLNNKLEEKVVERTLQLAQANAKLSKLDGAKSYFLSLLSHELNTPITAILGASELLQTYSKEEDEVELIDFLSESTKRLKKFSDDALLITRLKSEKYDLNMNEENIFSIFNEVISKYKNILNTKNIKISQLLPEEEKTFNIDFGLVYKCLDIIIDNAIKNSPDNSKICFEMQFIDKQFTIIITDEGFGFNEDLLNNAFNFFISDEIMHHKEGYGLGLATAELIMNAHSGEIKIGNNAVKGAFVKLIFPY